MPDPATFTRYAEMVPITEIWFAEIRVTVSLPRAGNTLTYAIRIDERMLDDLQSPPADLEAARAELGSVSDDRAHIWFSIRRQEAERRTQVIKIIAEKVAWSLEHALREGNDKRQR